MGECDVCGKDPEGSETACLDCETPLPKRSPGAATTKSVSDGQPRARSPRLVLVATLCIFLGFVAGWAASAFNGSTDPFSFVGSSAETTKPTESATSAPTGGAASPSGDPAQPIVSGGDCLDVPGFELLRGGIENLATRVVDCTSDTAVTVLVDAEEECENCQSTRVSNGQRIKFLEVPLVGRCFFAYFAPGSAGRGWPDTFVPCYLPPEKWVLDASENVASRLNVDPTELRLVTLVVTKVSDEEPTCGEGSGRWELTRRDPVVWLCAEEMRVH